LRPGGAGRLIALLPPRDRCQDLAESLPTQEPGRDAVGTVFGDEVLAAAILGRLLHHSFTLMIQGESFRLKQKRKTGLLGRAEKAN
jgi:hypothetical protein